MPAAFNTNWRKALLKIQKKKKWELVNFCEFDPYATKSYCGIHNVSEDLNLGDITKVNEKEMADFNMMVGGSPCQDFSVAGKQEGAKWTCKECGHEYNPLEAHYSKRDKCPNCDSTNIEKTRSSLLVEWLRILREKKPNFAIYENVKNIIGKQFKATFELFTDELNEYGYNTHYKVLNAKNYGVPQNRERVYLIIIKKELDNGKFEFPKPFDNGVRLKNVLEKEVDEKFYISQDKVARLVTNLNNKNALLYDSCQVLREGKAREYNEYSPTLTSRDYKDPRLVNCTTIDKSYNNTKTVEYANCITAREDRGISNRKAEGTAILNIVGRILPDSEKIHQNQEVYDSNNIMGTIKASHYKDAPKVLQRIENSVQQIGNIVNTGNWGNPQRGRIYSSDGCSPALNCCGGGGLEPKILEDFYSNRDIREYEDIAPTLRSERNGLKVIDSQQTINGAIRGRYTKCGTIEQQLELNDTQVLNTLTTVQKDNIIVGNEDVLNEVRIRKLTPKECFRLMGFNDEQFSKAEMVVSNSQLYKQAGNSIVVDVLLYILVELYKAMPYLFDEIKLSSFFSGIGAFEIALNRIFDCINNGTVSNFTQPQEE